MSHRERRADSVGRGDDEWGGRSDAELIEYIIERFHAPAKQELTELVAMARDVEISRGASPDQPKRLSVFLEAMAGELLMHINTEETALFPMIVRQTRGVEKSIATLMREHDQQGVRLAQLREMTRGFAPPEDGPPAVGALFARLQAFDAELTEHARFEDDVLFARILARDND